jgi:hypothetical protein
VERGPRLFSAYLIRSCQRDDSLCPAGSLDHCGYTIRTDTVQSLEADTDDQDIDDEIGSLGIYLDLPEIALGACQRFIAARTVTSTHLIACLTS